MSRLRLLLANDDPFLLCGYSDQLEPHFIVETAENGLQAVQIVSSFPPDHFHVVILDINMPIMDGYEACVRIYEHVSQSALKPQIYALTADANPETRERVLSHPFDDLFNKLDENIEIRQIRKESRDQREPRLQNFRIMEVECESMMSDDSEKELD